MRAFVCVCVCVREKEGGRGGGGGGGGWWWLCDHPESVTGYWHCESEVGDEGEEDEKRVGG